MIRLWWPLYAAWTAWAQPPPRRCWPWRRPGATHGLSHPFCSELSADGTAHACASRFGVVSVATANAAPGIAPPRRLCWEARWGDREGRALRGVEAVELRLVLGDGSISRRMRRDQARNTPMRRPAAPGMGPSLITGTSLRTATPRARSIRAGNAHTCSCLRLRGLH